METMTSALKRAVKESGLPMLTLEREAGINRLTVARFMRGRGSLRLDKADLLAKYLGLELRPVRRPRRRKGA